MKGLALILLLSSFTAFGQECEKVNSIVSFSKDVQKADQKLLLKELKNWYKERVTKQEAENNLMEFRSISDYPLNCETVKKDGEESVVCKGSQFLQRPVLPMKEGDKKSKNPYLAQVFSTRDSKIEKIDLESTGMGGFLYVVHKINNDGTKVQYKINPNLSAANNPIIIIDESKGKIEMAQIQPAIGVSFATYGIGW